MSAYRQILYHIVFRTKGSEKTINQDYSTDLYKYIWGVINNKKCVLFRINSMEDHVHILSDLHPSVALADYIKDIKVSSAKWMKNSGYFPYFKGWGIKYCALTYSYKERDAIINYIKNQQEHHKHESFQDEIKRLFKEQGIDLDEKWFWTDSWGCLKSTQMTQILRIYADLQNIYFCNMLIINNIKSALIY